MNSTSDTDTGEETALERGLVERVEPLRRTLERLDPVARAHFVEGLRILAEEIDVHDGGGRG